MKYAIQVGLMTALFVNLSCTKKDQFQGYETLSRERVSVIGSDLVQLQHKESGAHVVLIKNQDPARTFMVGFRTPPYDDTGLFHIFEHAVLEGSRLYPSKSNFFHVANSTVASFINAMTGSVYTLYPYTTLSDKDFDNLLSVYLDAVFFPKVLEDPRIIQREGWRYEVNPETKAMSINGIVLSEMKGAYSDPRRILNSELNRALVPDTPYAFSSGGLPHQVSTLTFEQIKQAHQKYYHPQNSVIYLYGDIDYPRILEKIDKDFLSEFKATEDFQEPEIPVQKDFNYLTDLVEGAYPGDLGENRDFVAKGFVLGKDLNPIEQTAAYILSQAFATNNVAPLKLRALDEGVAKTVSMQSVGGMENTMAVVFEGAEGDQREKIGKILKEEINKVVEGGLDPKLLTSILNQYEFSYKEKNSNGAMKGLQMAFITLMNWIDKDEPLNEALDFVSHFKKVRLLLSDQEFVKNFFKKRFANNDKTRWVVLRPDPNYSDRFQDKLNQQVASALKEKPIEHYLKEHLVFEKWVAEKEPKEMIQNIPTLELTDIKADEEPIPWNDRSLDGVELIEYPQNTAGIHYVKLFFDLKGVSEADLKKLPLLMRFLKKTDTKNLSFKELSTELDTYVGQLSIGLSTYQSVKDPNEFKPRLVVSLSYINENKDKAFELLQEILVNSQLAPKARVSQLVNETKTQMTNSIGQRAPGLAQLAAEREFFPHIGAFNELTGGGAFENFMLKESWETQDVVRDLKKVIGKLFNQNSLSLVTTTADAADLAPLKEKLTDFKAQLPKDEVPAQKWAFSERNFHDGYIVPGEVQYIYQITPYKEAGLEHSGSMKVFANFLNNNFMLPKLREQAGAYGARSSFSRSGLFTLSSYRDPNLKKSLDIFSQALDFMGEQEFSEKDLKPAILGSLKPYYSDDSIAAKTAFMTQLRLTDMTWSDYMQTKKEILNTTAKDLKKINTALKKAVAKSRKSVSGNKKKVQDEGGFLKNVLTLQ